jgi:hypothetical protein
MGFPKGSTATGNTNKYIQLTAYDYSCKKKKSFAVPFLTSQFAMDCGLRYEIGFSHFVPTKYITNILCSSFHVLGKARDEICLLFPDLPHTEYREIRNETNSV